MKAWVYVIGALTLLFLATALVAGCGKEEASVSDGAAPVEASRPVRETTSVGGAEIAQKLCPVMGEAIDKNVYLDHEGRRVYFCCPMCVDTFKKDPGKYLAKLDAQLRS